MGTWSASNSYRPNHILDPQKNSFLHVRNFILLLISEPFLPPKICFELYKFGVTAVRNLGKQKQIMPRPIESGVSFPISGRSQRACQMDATMPKVMPKAKARLLTKGKIKTKTMLACPVSSCVDTSDLCLLRWLWNQHMCVCVQVQPWCYAWHRKPNCSGVLDINMQHSSIWCDDCDDAMLIPAHAPCSRDINECW